MDKKFSEGKYVRAYEQRAVNRELARSEATGAPIRMHLTSRGRSSTSRGRASRKQWVTLLLVVLVIALGAVLLWLLPLAIHSLGG